MAEGGKTGWLLLAVAVQFVWGIYPVMIRFLQTKTPHPLTSLQLSFVINLMSLPALLFGDILNLVLGWLCGGGGNKEGGGAPAPVVVVEPDPWAPAAPALSADGDSPSAPLLPGDRLGDGAGAQAAAAKGDALPPAPPTPAAALAGEPPAGRVVVVPPAPRALRPEPTLLSKCLVLAGTTAGLTGLFLTQVYSLRFTAAYMSQMLFLLAPLMVALMARLLFKSPLPPGLWTSLALMLLGSGMVIGSKAANAPPRNALGLAPLAHRPAPLTGGDLPPAAGISLWPGVLVGLPPHLEQAAWTAAAAAASGSSGGNSSAAAAAVAALVGGAGGAKEGAEPSRWLAGPGEPTPGPGPTPPPPRKSGLTFGDVIGLTLALGSALSLASYLLIVQRSQGMVTEQAVLWAGWWVLRTLLPREWGCVAGTAFGVNWAANLLQQITVRRLGAPQAAAFLPVRLLGSLVASYPILHEGLGSWTEAAGAALLLGAVTGYLLRQRKAALDAAREAAAALLEAAP
eukprot:scaffold21.g2161.t1